MHSSFCIKVLDHINELIIVD